MFKKRSTWIIVGAIIIAVAGGFYWLVSAQTASSTNAEEAPLQTASVRQGNLTISATGVGSIISTSDVINTSLISQLIQANLSVIQAQQNYQSIQAQYPSTVANAQVALLAAQTTVDLAVQNRAQMNYSRCNNTTRADYLEAYNNALANYSENPTNQNTDSLANAEINWTYCISPWSDTEIAQADAELAAAQATYQNLLVEYEAMVSSGTSNNLIVAQSQLAIALAQLAAMEPEALVDPSDPTISAALGNIQEVNNSGGVTLLADLGTPLLKIYLDESDLINISLGDPVIISFDSIPNVTLTGTVTFIYSQLSSVDGVMVVSALVQMDADSATDYSDQLLVGLSASVEVIRDQVTNVLLVPVEAVREISIGNYAVFVVNDSGELEMRTVTVGVQDLVYAEITNGLEAGEVVSTGLVETSNE
jgi:multidrug efflux pump subunit AcrA (membrane-fusion protein)